MNKIEQMLKRSKAKIPYEGVARKTFDAGIKAGDGRDYIIVDMVKEGVPLNYAQRWYRDFSKEREANHTVS